MHVDSKSVGMYAWIFLFEAFIIILCHTKKIDIFMKKIMLSFQYFMLDSHYHTFRNKSRVMISGF